MYFEKKSLFDSSITGATYCCGSPEVSTQVGTAIRFGRFKSDIPRGNGEILFDSDDAYVGKETCGYGATTS